MLITSRGACSGDNAIHSRTWNGSGGGGWNCGNGGRLSDVGEARGSRGEEHNRVGRYSANHVFFGRGQQPCLPRYQL